MKRIFETAVISLVTAIAVVMIGFAPMPRVLAQSTRVGGLDVPVTPFEQWFKRNGFLNSRNGCDVAIEYDSLNTLHVTDCTDAANLVDLRLRGVQVNGMPSTQGAAGSDTSFTKTVGSIANASATTILTISVPNASGGATVDLTLNCSLGAGGAVGAYEEVFTAYGQVVVSRTAGVAAVATAVSLSNTGSAHVSGGDSSGTLAYSLASVTGGASATDSVPVQVTVSRGAGSSTNHSCAVSGNIVNAVGGGTGISIS